MRSKPPSRSVRWSLVLLAIWTALAWPLLALPLELATPAECRMACSLDGGGCCCTGPTKPAAPVAEPRSEEHAEHGDHGEHGGHDGHGPEMAGQSEASAAPDHTHPVAGQPSLELPWRPCPNVEIAFDRGGSSPFVHVAHAESSLAPRGGDGFAPYRGELPPVVHRNGQELLPRPPPTFS